MQLGKGAFFGGRYACQLTPFESLESRAMLAYSFDVIDEHVADIFFPAGVSGGDGSAAVNEDTGDTSDPLPAIPFDSSVSPFHDCPGLPPELCLPGDLDASGSVDFSDFLQLSANLGLEEATWQDGDFSGDGLVSMTDFLILSRNFGQTI